MIRPITLWPFPKDALKDAAAKVKGFLSVELNMGQMVDDVKLAINCSKPVYFYGRTGGVLMTPDEIVAKLNEIEKGDAKEW
jgi:2-oxoglutarate ferredoxin oxidoreductase subunit alpha